MATRFKDPEDCGVYSITSPSGNQYIGSSLNISYRFRDHKRELRFNNHHSDALQNAWNKYKEQLEFKKILICRVEDLLFYEQLLIDNFKPEYNICSVAGRPVGNKSRLGKPHSKETRLKQSLSRKGIQYSLETREKMRQSGKIKIFSEEHRKNISLAGIGRIHSLETKSKMRDAALKRWSKEKSN